MRTAIYIKLTNISLQQQLQQFLWTQLTSLDRLGFPGFAQLLEPISVFRLSHHLHSIIYRCAIAFQLTRYSSLPPITLAEEIFQWIEQQHSDPVKMHCHRDQENYAQASYLNFTLTLIDPGWLEFTLSDRSLAVWLQTWETFPFPTTNSLSLSGNHHNLFAIEYTYARCCALLRLGDQEGLIQLKSQAFPPYVWSLEVPKPIPWYNLDLGQLRLNNIIERSLISQIMTTIERVINESDGNKMKLGSSLSDSFLKFESYCRIFSELNRENSQLSQTRLGLVAITQYLLQGLWLSNMEQPPRNQL